MHLLLSARHDSGTPLPPDLAAPLWARLRLLFPLALVAVVLPSAARLVVPAASPGDAAGRLRTLLDGLRRGPRPSGPWILDPSVVLRRPGELERGVRDVASSPCDVPGVHDPLEWLFSTHRDVVGATARPWVTSARLAAASGRSDPRFAERLHQEVSAEGRGRPSPFPRLVGGALGASLEDIDRAAAASVRSVEADGEPPARAVDLFLVIGRALGRPTSALCDYLGRRPGDAYARMARPAPGEVDAALLCLSDARLRSPRDARLRSLRIGRPGAGPARGAEGGRHAIDYPPGA